MGFPVDEPAIARGEQQLGRRLPEALRERLMRDNGGEIEVDGGIRRLHPVFDTTDRKRISRTANHIIRETESAREGRHGFSDAAVVIAADGSGDLIILLPDTDDVQLWLHEDGTHSPVEVELGPTTDSPRVASTWCARTTKGLRNSSGG